MLKINSNSLYILSHLPMIVALLLSTVCLFVLFCYNLFIQLPQHLVASLVQLHYYHNTIYVLVSVKDTITDYRTKAIKKNSHKTRKNNSKQLMSDIFEKSTALQEEGETVVSITSSGKKKVVDISNPKKPSAGSGPLPNKCACAKRMEMWVWFLFALRYSDWKRRLTSRDSNLGSEYFDSQYCHRKWDDPKRPFFFFLPACIRFSPSNFFSIINVLLTNF